ncbi:restriction endonuclease [Neisseria meningitidis]|uniref:restriction endonuclease n=1 Tax=Neisseria meningitidis TaxID=487 RepID=UPI0009B72EA7|nr:restriction endonuclease [Neisseria meningitidis]ARC12025.1 restriction endonuclease [Neisseria meningitidis]MBG9084763.1 restriction endonuclease [Neisseria meningitidis]MBG9095615.1 restriction endonuclease [Neisseria meningitidis]MBG9145201.1 restriction endonuclease [Neisseria meningitidis]MBG9155648.1 restriction endonuclease [Neisseria meningitidis]
MNLWTQKSIDLAGQSNYLDQLYRVYPMSVNVRRELSESTQNEIRTYLNNQNGKNLLNVLLEQEIFPIKDSYVAYLKRDKTAINRNPATVSRLAGMLIEMGFDEILDKTTVPKETNRQIGPLFKNWISSGALGVPVTDDVEKFLSYQENIVFNASDKAMQNFAKNHLGYQHEKGLDFIAKFNNKFIIGEAKFLTDFGGHQNAQFNDAITTMRAPLAESDYTVQTIAILDGVLYIKGQNKMFKDLSSFKDNEVVISTVLLRDYLFSV